MAPETLQPELHSSDTAQRAALATAALRGHPAATSAPLPWQTERPASEPQGKRTGTELFVWQMYMKEADKGCTRSAAGQPPPCYVKFCKC